MAYTRVDKRRKLKKNAYHTKFIQNLKNVYKFLMNIFVLFASFEAFWSLKNNEHFSIKNCLTYTIFINESYKIIILS